MALRRIMSQMVVDTSAIIAILRKESSYERAVKEIVFAEVAWISSVNLLESYVVMGDRHHEVAELLQRASINVHVFTAAEASIARSAFLQFGKGRHKAALNIC